MPPSLRWTLCYDIFSRLFKTVTHISDAITQSLHQLPLCSLIKSILLNLPFPEPLSQDSAQEMLFYHS